MKKLNKDAVTLAIATISEEVDKNSGKLVTNPVKIDEIAYALKYIRNVEYGSFV